MYGCAIGGDFVRHMHDDLITPAGFQYGAGIGTIESKTRLLDIPVYHELGTSEVEHVHYRIKIVTHTGVASTVSQYYENN